MLDVDDGLIFKSDVNEFMITGSDFHLGERMLNEGEPLTISLLFSLSLRTWASFAI
jgi:hypothetical protein